MAHFKFAKRSGILLQIVLIMAACSGSKPDAEVTDDTREAALLLQYLEENGDVVNHPNAPFFIDAQEIHEQLKNSNLLVIDVRQSGDYNRGYIAHAVNVFPENILDYFENRIEPMSFEKIVIVCNNGHLSGYITAILRMLGYDNTYNLRFGMSAWNESIARRFWYANISDDLVGFLEEASHPKNEPGKLPRIRTEKTSGYEILRERAKIALELNWDQRKVNFMDVLLQTEDYYVINYWPYELYEQGHLPGAIQYNPQTSLGSDSDILTLPNDRPIIVYSYTGQNEAYINAFFAVMGYDFRSLDYGANSFIHQTINLTQPTGRSFSEIHVNDFQLSTEILRDISAERSTPVQQVKITKIEGGC